MSTIGVQNSRMKGRGINGGRVWLHSFRFDIVWFWLLLNCVMFECKQLIYFADWLLLHQSLSHSQISNLGIIGVKSCWRVCFKPARRLCRDHREQYSQYHFDREPPAAAACPRKPRAARWLPFGNILQRGKSSGYSIFAGWAVVANVSGVLCILHILAHEDCSYTML